MKKVLMIGKRVDNDFIMKAVVDGVVKEVSLSKLCEKISQSKAVIINATVVTVDNN